MAGRERVASTRRAFLRRTLEPLASLSGTPAHTPPLFAADPTGEESWLALCALLPAQLESAAECALGFTSRVSLEPPEALLLEVRGSFRLFGGARALGERLLAALSPISASSVRWAIAPTPRAALAFARAATDGGAGGIVLSRDRLVGQLAPLPLQVLGVSPELLARCESIGVRTLGAALRLPRSGLARRFGPSLLQALDQLIGRAPEPRRAFRARERLYAALTPEYELTHHETLLRHVMPLLEQFEQALRARQCGIDSLQLRLVHRPYPERGIPPATTLELRFATAGMSAAHFHSLLAEHLARCRLPAPVVRGELRSGALQAFHATSDVLWRPAEQGGAVTREAPALIERLRARLGSQSVYALCLVPQHRPEAAWQVAEPKLAAVSAQRHHTSASIVVAAPCEARRPLWLLRDPAPLPDAPACLRALEGPERIETGWWDGSEVTRDYYIARDAEDAELWVYRERRAPHGWFLHGVFG